MFYKRKSWVNRCGKIIRFFAGNRQRRKVRNDLLINTYSHSFVLTISDACTGISFLLMTTAKGTITFHTNFNQGRSRTIITLYLSLRSTTKGAV